MNQPADQPSSKVGSRTITSMPPQLEVTDGAKAVQAAPNRCFVCETLIAGGHWFAQVKHGDWTVRLCCPRCMRNFFAQRLPLLRRVGFLAALGSLAWPGRQSARLKRK